MKRFVRVSAKALGSVAVVCAVLWGTLLYQNRPPHLDIPSHSVPKDNAYDDWLAAGKMALNIKPVGPLSDTRPVESWTVEQLAEFVEANQPVFDRFRKGLGKQYKHPPLRGYKCYRSDRPFRELARRLVGLAMYQERTNNPYQAEMTRLDCAEMGVCFGDGGSCLSEFTGIAVEAIALADFPQLLGKLSPEQLEEVQSRLGRIQARRPSWSDVIEEDGNVTVSLWEDVMDDKNFLSTLFEPGRWVPGTSELTLKRRLQFLLFAFQNKKRAVVELQDHYRNLAVEMGGSVYSGPAEKSIPSGILGEFSGDAGSGVAATMAAWRAVVEILRVECALRRYSAGSGSYPRMLEELTPRYLSSVPVDPCGGKRVRYRAAADGQTFLLYSIGKNLKDDGGLAGKWRDPKAKSDIVAGKWNLSEVIPQ